MKRLPGWLVFAILLWLCWAVLAPMVAGPIREPKTELNAICPSPGRVHGVGGNLKTTVREVDWCAQK